MPVNQGHGRLVFVYVPYALSATLVSAAFYSSYIMKNLLTSIAFVAAVTASLADTPVAQPDFNELVPDRQVVNPEEWVDTALLGHRQIPGPEKDADGFMRLTEQDYREVAEELGVEVAAIKAVVDIEAGAAHRGFWAPGKPIINFDLSMYRRYAAKRGVSLSAAKKKSPVIFRRPDVRRYGSQQAGQQARLDAARAIDDASAIEGTFWGMFQIGGFNWKKLGFSSPMEMAEAMSKSEREQLEIFARFITEFNMLDALRSKNWLGFALKYNGPRARARGYHTRMARAYAKHKQGD